MTHMVFTPGLHSTKDKWLLFWPTVAIATLMGVPQGYTMPQLMAIIEHATSCVSQHITHTSLTLHIIILHQIQHILINITQYSCTGVLQYHKVVILG